MYIYIYVSVKQNFESRNKHSHYGSLNTFDNSVKTIQWRKIIAISTNGAGKTGCPHATE